MREPGFYPNIPEAEYHADRDSLSVSGAKVLLQAPALFRHRQDNPEHKDVFDFGSAAHALVLGVGAEVVEVDADSWRTKAAGEARDAARAQGKTPLLAKDAAKVRDMADALSGHAGAMSLLSGGQPEVSAYAVDEWTGVMRRCRYDYLRDDVAVDYKSAADISPGGFQRACLNYGYAMQAAWYLDVATDLGQPLSDFGFIAQAKEAPYLVEVYRLDDDFLALGRARNLAALERFRDCRDSGKWPGYTGRDFTTLTAPKWARNDDLQEMTA